MPKKPRPKSKAERLQERRKNFLDDDEQAEELFLDEGGSAEEDDDDLPEEIARKKPRLDNNVDEMKDSDDDMPEEVSYKKPEGDDADFYQPKKPEPKKHTKTIRKEEPGVYSVETEDLKVKVVAQKTVTPGCLPRIHFKQMLFDESTIYRRKKVGPKVDRRWFKTIKRR
uniref:Uncharacterized protein n=1 Tax=Panagrolaimus sp. JU765 TaxID=591449 RepID=A0AC34QQL6_9BILA